jgi:hypothetical protein
MSPWGVTVVQLPHDLVDNELRVAVNVKPRGPHILPRCLSRGSVAELRKGVDPPWGRSVRCLLPLPIEGERVIKVHAPVLLGHQGRQLLRFCPFFHEICQRMGLDCCLRDICHIKPHKHKSPLRNPSCGEAIPGNFSELVRCNHTDRVTFEIVQELAFRN